MKKKSILLVSFICLILLTFAGCGSNNDAMPSSEGNVDITGRESFNDKEEKDGYDESTNVTVTINDWTLSVPTYWEADIVESDSYRAYAEAGEKVAILQVSTIQEDHIITFEQFDSKMDSISESMIDSTDDFRNIQEDKFEQDGLAGILYTFDFTINDLDGKGEFLVSISGKDDYLVIVELLATDNTIYSYWNDFEKILKSITTTHNETESEIVTENNSQKDKDASTEKSSTVTEKESDSVAYSTNKKDTVKNGNSGIYAYKSRGGTYDNYYIIDFDEGTVKFFSDGNGNEICDRVKIVSGTLNDVLVITYHDGASSWSYGLHFKWKNQPDHLVVEDQDGFEYDYSSTNLDIALQIMNTKQIYDY